MAKELGEPLSILERISPRDKEVILLAPLFFWGKYIRRQVLTEYFKPDIPPVDFDDLLSVLGAGFENADIEGDIVGAVSDILSKHPMRSDLFPYLDDGQIRDICRELDDIFENEEFCAECESRSYYDVEPEQFAISTADTMLYLGSRHLGIPWYGKIFGWKNRQTILKAILREKSQGNISGLLSSGEDSAD